MENKLLNQIAAKVSGVDFFYALEVIVGVA